MDLAVFWRLVDDARAEVDAAGSDAIVEACEDRLAVLPPADIVGFGLRKWQLRDDAYRTTLWAAAYLIQGGCSDDAFMDFREGLISLGSVWYGRAVADPDALAGHPLVSGGGDVLIGDEDFGYVGGRAYGDWHAYNDALGDHPEAAALQVVTDPVGEDWDFRDDDEMRRRLPRLAALFL